MKENFQSISVFENDVGDLYQMLKILENGATNIERYPTYNQTTGERLIVGPDQRYISEIRMLIDRLELPGNKMLRATLGEVDRTALEDGIIKAKIYLSAFNH